MKIVYTFKARQDLKDIYEYIAHTLLAPDAAKNTTNKIIEIIRSLETMPERNPLYKDEPWHSQGLRFVPVNNYLVFYMVNTSTDTVSIVRIMYGARDIAKQLEETGDQA